MTDVEFGDKLETIGINQVFHSCTSLTNFTMPSVRTIFLTDLDLIYPKDWRQLKNSHAQSKRRIVMPLKV